MDVDALKLAQSDLTTEDSDHVSWIYCCLHYRLTYIRPPMSVRSLIMTVYCKEYERFMQLLEIGESLTIDNVAADSSSSDLVDPASDSALELLAVVLDEEPASLALLIFILPGLDGVDGELGLALVLESLYKDLPGSLLTI